MSTTTHTVVSNGEHIDIQTESWWVCLCGNTAGAEGFFPCTAAGIQVEPTVVDWPEALYVCDRSGRIIDSKTGQVRGVSEAQVA